MRSIYYSLVFLTLIGSVYSCKGNPPAAKEEPKVPVEVASIQWLTFEEAVAKNAENPKQIFIDFFTDWCGWCKVMDKNTFTDPEVIKLMNKYFYAVKFNAEQKEPIVFAGKTYNFIAQGNRGYHELAASIMQGEMSYPTGIFLNEKYEIVTPLKGYVAPREFEPILSFLGQRKYENDESFETFKANYKSAGTEDPPINKP